MIIATYGIAGLMLAAVCYPFAHGMLTAKTLGICFTIIFFVASSAASAAYLTVSEVFPLEIRAFAIAIFYAIGTLIGALMLLGALFEGLLGVEAAGKSLESVSKPLQSA
jgi:hypothetical protein